MLGGRRKHTGGTIDLSIDRVDGLATSGATQAVHPRFETTGETHERDRVAKALRQQAAAARGTVTPVRVEQLAITTREFEPHLLEPRQAMRLGAISIEVGKRAWTVWGYDVHQGLLSMSRLDTTTRE
jgi:hypothetical protein